LKKKAHIKIKKVKKLGRGKKGKKIEIGKWTQNLMKYRAER